MESTSISAFYAGRSIFITGGTGFMGKVLIEKLLRSCPDIQEIFLLMRPKRGMSIDDRLRKMIALPLFEKLWEKDPSVFKKLIPVTGDVAEEGLGLPTVERRVITEKVSIIFHVAASVRFDDPLKTAILMNTRGTREVCILATSMKKLVVLLHVSTTYCNTDRPVIDEILYPPHADWKKTIKIAETIDNNTLNIMTPKYLGKLPNTYTFTKQLAEHVINDYAGVIPSVIFRPSVVISSFSEPVAGWIDNFNGPVGLLIGGGTGVLRVVFGNSDVLADFMPVDIAIKSMLMTAWMRGTTTLIKDPSISVYNCSSNGIRAITNADMIAMGFKFNEEIPFDTVLWRPGTVMHSNRTIYYIGVLLLHLLPAVILDGLLKLNGAKPRLISLQRKVYTANVALEYFLRESWTFKNEKLLQLQTKLQDINKPEFEFDIGGIDIPSYFRDALIGSKRYLLKEDLNRVPQAKAHYNKMWWIDRVIRIWFTGVLSWVAISSGLLGYILSCITSVFDGLLSM